ncbi:hypothetical protein PG999_009983 [Apiospora kogelbergensis]|uniref:Rhodopsin domain-containing protein n=1 Tax=Apiospora kogelbergensis TaxID=1337665 RepID=A0AAW0QMF3_9PEZI
MAKGLDHVISWYICTIFALAFVAVRQYHQWRRLRKFTLNDGFILLGASCLVGDLGIQHYMWSRGMAEMEQATPDDFKAIMQMIVPGSILYVTSLWAIKVALTLLYKKIAAPGTRIQVVYNIMLGWLSVTWLLIFFDIIFQCWPHDKRWLQNPDYECSPKASDINYWVTILLNIFTDVIIIRAYYSKRNETMLTCTVSMVETAIAIIAASLPALRSLVIERKSRSDNSAYTGQYELSSSNRRPTLPSRTMTSTAGKSRSGQNNNSEDELVKSDMTI